MPAANEANACVSDSGVDARVATDEVTWHALLEFCHTHIGRLDVQDRAFRTEYAWERRLDGTPVAPDLPEPVATFLAERERFGIKVGLDNMRALMDRLGLETYRVPTLLVGGTNGKGTVASALGDAFARIGLRPGVYTSPHVERFIERIQISGGDPDLDALAQAGSDVMAATKDLDGAGVHPTYFEVATALALDVFRRHGVDVMVLEVGLGGRGDAVNVVGPSASVITNVGTDHLERLGTSLEERVREKAGIMRAGVPCFTAAQGPALGFLKKEAMARGTPLVPCLPTSPEVNAEAANMALVRTIVGHDTMRRRMRALRYLDPLSTRLPHLPGRTERFTLPNGTQVVLDVAHNPEALLTLAYHVDRSSVPTDQRVLLCAQRADKDPEGIARVGRDRFVEIHVTRPIGEQARSATDLASEFTERGIDVARVDEHPGSAFAHALRATPRGGMLVVAGSFYLASAVRPMIRKVTRGDN